MSEALVRKIAHELEGITSRDAQKVLRLVREMKESKKTLKPSLRKSGLKPSSATAKKSVKPRKRKTIEDYHPVLRTLKSEADWDEWHKRTLAELKHRRATREEIFLKSLYDIEHNIFYPANTAEELNAATEVLTRDGWI